ncbi:branched-chain amino acid ABC transporter permease [Ralstonia solanacearum]|uniref:branched-chain amino acid ABC transporter permease n=1 Tax=Ralstonia solanacearum TaxID=305 RepID=UPI001F099E32|nr:branched-chain amino acid ABC transporter permease [Ralstonia solanacearum]
MRSRLCDGDVPDARHRPRRRVPERSARFHGLPRLEGTALVLARHRALRLGRAAGGAGAGRAGVLFGFFAFRSRVKGVYLSIITQAMTYAAMLLFFRNETGFGGNNGFTDFKRILGFPIAAVSTRTVLFVATFIALVLALIACRAIVTSKFGRVVTAIRDAEARVMFSGYNPLGYKLFVWTFSAVLCGIAGALYVPQVGIINPGEMSPGNSIEMAVWVAVAARHAGRPDRRRFPRQCAKTVLTPGCRSTGCSCWVRSSCW